jgi:hypothetical protein
MKDIHQLCPPLFALGLLRIDSPSSHRSEVYRQDKEFFHLHKVRNLYLRAAYFGEFDLEMEIGDRLRVPTLHVLVTQLATGFHQVAPLYRGKPFFHGNEATDLEVMQIVVEMARRNGIDKLEWVAYAEKQLERTMGALPAKTEAVH